MAKSKRNIAAQTITESGPTKKADFAPTITKDPNRKTRPKYVFDLNKIEEYAATGGSQRAIAAVIGCSEATFQSRMRDDDNFRAAVTRGRARKEMKAAQQLDKLIDDGNPQAVMFYLKTRCGWSEKLDVQADVNANVNANASIAIEHKIENMSDDELVHALEKMGRVLDAAVNACSE